ncbi:MAG: transcriptional coactivator p15/PC4 family protein [Spirochaetes bacterium]|nr:transcriptional coactivator p15/PC4 family protein [Spirochaetota bacterium]
MEEDKKTIATMGLDSSGAPLVKEPIFISLSSYKNSKYLDIRKHYFADDQWLPTKKGVTLQYSQINELQQILNDHADEIKSWFDEQ